MNYPKLKRLELYQDEVYQALKNSSVVEVKEEEYENFEGIFQFVKRRFVKTGMSFMGFEVESIKEMTKKQFETFEKKKKEFELNLVKQPKYQVLIATVGSACSKMIRDLEIKYVLIDEATQVKEPDSYIATANAEKIVLIGDQNQLGPTINFKLDGPTSMFQRFVNAQYDYNFLPKSFRMHPSLLRVPNSLFYDNKIKCGYTAD